jgi:hypothetical protein
MLKKLAILILASGCIMTAKADGVSLSSSAAVTTNNSGSATQNVIGNAAWAAPLSGSSWVSFANTGDTSDPGFVLLANGTSATFSQTFNLSGTVTDATLDVLADDMASVFLNGNQIFPTNSGNIGWLSSTEGIFDMSQIAPYLVDGTNTISFVVSQEGGYSYGLDYSGVITTPEPGSLMLLASGLIGLVGFGRRKLPS